jgi:hypothetical protein
MCAGGSRAHGRVGVVGEVVGKRGGVSADRRAAKGGEGRSGERARGDGEAQDGGGCVTRPHRIKGEGSYLGRLERGGAHAEEENGYSKIIAL